MIYDTLQPVTQELAIKLKDVGFNAPCEYTYYDDFDRIKMYCIHNWNEGDFLSAPCYQSVIQWFEEHKRLKLRLIPFTSGNDQWDIWAWQNAGEGWSRVKMIGKVSIEESITELIEYCNNRRVTTESYN